MPSGTDFDIREAPQGLRRLVEERERMYLGERAYRTLNERGHLQEILDSEVIRARAAFRYLVKELRAKRYSDREAHARAWQSLVRNWPFALDDGEPEKEAPTEKEPACWPRVVTVTAKNGRRYVLICQEPMSEDFKRFVRKLQGEPGMHDPTGERSSGPDDLPEEELVGRGVKDPFDESKEKKPERTASHEAATKGRTGLVPSQRDRPNKSPGREDRDAKAPLDDKVKNGLHLQTTPVPKRDLTTKEGCSRSKGLPSVIWIKEKYTISTQSDG